MEEGRYVASIGYIAYSKCKGPEAGLSLVSSGEYQNACMAGVPRVGKEAVLKN